MMRILLVDDEPDLREQLGSLLTRQKYIVDTAADGEGPWTGFLINLLI